MPSKELIHRFELEGRKYAIDPETCFCFECDDVSWDVLEYYPTWSVTFILNSLQSRHDPKEIKEVISELEWLRATRSILPHLSGEKFIKLFELKRGIRHLWLRVGDTEKERLGIPTEKTRTWSWLGKPKPSLMPRQSKNLIELGTDVLFARAQEQKELTLTIEPISGLFVISSLISHLNQIFNIAKVAAKKVTPILALTDLQLEEVPDEFKLHRIHVCVEFQSEESIQQTLKLLESSDKMTVSQLLKISQIPHVQIRTVVEPSHASFAELIPTLYNLGLRYLELDLNAAFVRYPQLNFDSVLDNLKHTALFYSESLQANRYFRLEPIASLFYRIHEGKPEHRSDPAGLHELAIDEKGIIYPSKYFLTNTEFQVGALLEGKIDEGKLAQFDDVGSLTTGVCRRCWARNLCGGGYAAVHQSLSGSFRSPYEPWCNMQRNWMEHAISIFNLLNSAGINFSRIYTPIVSPTKKSLSLVSMVRAAMQMSVLMRPIEDSDASLLVKWENWNDASYFVCHPGGLLLATVYEREMDALHPQGLEQEMIITRRNGEPIGLFRIQPDKIPGVAYISMYFHQPSLYSDIEIRKGCRFLLDEAAKQQTIRSLLTQVGSHEPDLQDFLRAIGFDYVGTLREALFLHGAYKDVLLFALKIN